MKRGLITLLVGLVVASPMIAGYQWALSPAATPSGDRAVRIVDIPEGATFRQVAGLLASEHLITNQWAFRLLGKVTRAERRVLPGEYALHPGMSPWEILSELQSGHVVLHQVTIPEGYTTAQIADHLGQKGLVDRAEFIRLAHDREFIRTLDLDVPSLEGYLFPNTYRFARHSKVKDLIKTFVAGLWQAFTPELRTRAKEVNMSVHQVLTLASVIEKETGVEGERELVSAVFHNRLRRNLPLESDPTVIYALEAFDGNLKKRDLAVMSPYNTYRVTGLPPGPIANPGAHAIRAALYPAPTTHLYFVSRNDGSHHFSSTLEEHNRAVDRYQRRQARRTS